MKPDIQNHNLFITNLNEIFPLKAQQTIDFLNAENKILKEKLLQYSKRIHFTDADREELVRHGIPIKDFLGKVCTIVKPETILAWYRKMKKEKWNYNRKGMRKRFGRPSKGDETERIIISLASGNKDWGYKRISGEMKKLGHDISPATVRNLMKKHGFQPSPKRKGMNWKDFLSSHKQDRWAADFFTEEVLTAAGLITCYVLFFINITTKRVFIAGCTRYPISSWMNQQARNFLMWIEEQGMKCKYLVHDNDTSFSALDSTLKSAGIKIAKTPVHTPICNCFAERFVKEVRESLDKLIIFGDRHLYIVLKCVEKFHNEYRPHQGIDNCVPIGYDYPLREARFKDVKCMQALGGILKHYYSTSKAA
jgi:putative transposase